MRLAWFRATPPDSGALLDRSARLLQTLGRTHTIDVLTPTRAHDFVWKHDREPYDVCVYELGSSHADRFVWPYLLHYPGVVWITDTAVSDRRAWGNSRLVVVADAAIAQVLAFESPAARVRVAPVGSASPGSAVSGLRSAVLQGVNDVGTFAPLSPPIETADRRPATGDRDVHPGLAVGLLEPGRRDVVERAIERGRQRGASVTLIADEAPDSVLRHADVIVAIDWPPAAGPPAGAVHALARDRPVVVLEGAATAAWPALDPQTWQPRGFSSDPPIAVSIDPRDEEHSLMLAIVRLAADPSLRAALAAAGRAWWQAHATIDHALAGWETILREAETLDAAAPEPAADGSERARAILAEMGVEVDFIG